MTSRFLESEQPGLEPVPRDDLPEVAGTPWGSGQPAKYSPVPDTQNEKFGVLPPEPNPTKSGAVPSYEPQHEGPKYMHSGQQEYQYGEHQPAAQGNTTDRRILGMKRKVFFIAIAIVVLVIIIIAAVLGGVLGTRHSSSNTAAASTNTTTNSTSPGTAPGATNTPISVMQYSGLALSASPVNSTLYSYYQDTAGNIIEAVYPNAPNGTFNHTSSAIVVNSGDVVNNSALAAIAWKDASGTANRALFYADANRHLRTKNTTSLAWGSDSTTIIPGDLLANGSATLSAIVDTSSIGLNGIRLFYGSGVTPNISEAALSFSGGGWQYIASQFPESGVYAGCSCTFGGSSAVLYYRNGVSGVLSTAFASYSDEDPKFEEGVTGESFPANTGLAAVRGQGSTDHIFYQKDDGSITYAIFDNSGEAQFAQGATGINIDVQRDQLQNAHLGSKFAAIYLNDGPVVMYQQANDWSVVLTQQVQNNGVSKATAVE